MELLLTVMLVITAFFFTCSVRQFINNSKAKQKRLMMMHRLTSTAKVEDEHGSSRCHVSLGERNVQCLAIANSRFIVRQRSEAMSEYTKTIMKKTKQLIKCTITLVRNAVRRCEIKFDVLKRSFAMKKVKKRRSVLVEVK
jgi:hypothetical protein